MDSIWAPINSSDKEIRIVAIEPSSDFDAEISCKLRIASLKHDPLPEFAALSYAWGPATLTKQIRVNSAAISVTPNLEKALRYLRRKDKAMMYWIDAISIDQGDWEEKMQQVRLMSYIYRCSTMVCVWLGEPSEYSPLGMSLLGGVDSDPSQWLYEQPMDADYALECAEALKEILSRPWWSRLWTAQEFALAPVSKIACGWRWFDSEQLIKHDAFSRVVKHLQTHGLSKAFGWSLYKLWRNTLAPTVATKSLWNFMPGRERWQMALLFGMILEQCASRQCSDDRDRVFALLGLIPEPLTSSMNVDYSSSVENVFQTFTINLIRHLSSLKLLLTSGLGHQSVPNLPSWVPDLSMRRLEWLPAWYEDSRTSFSAFARKHWAWAHASNQLILKGVRVGSIPADRLGVVSKKTFVSLNPDDVAEARRALHSWMVLCGVVGQERGAALYSNGSSKAEAFYRTVCGDTKTIMSESGNGDSSVRLQASDIDAIIKNVGWEETRMLDDGTGAVRYLLPPSVGDRRLFVTDTGYFGNGGPSVEPNDQVFILMGCHYPAILRPMDSTPQLTTYKLVETCYVHGVMDGEFFDGVSISEPSEPVAAYLERVEKFGDHAVEPVVLC
ncbi:hypothetical protein PV11_05416 [Exophiala sideris]|uniref:Heterokaryon incompatibility domain-containing protein n=1 Tax=Exophiala sideris TaxID=1016849 RepID=A0A0D1W3N7_9EURO|nr:hypothetical protein PV11_05416 [Exophiala sideris]